MIMYIYFCHNLKALDNHYVISQFHPFIKLKVRDLLREAEEMIKKRSEAAEYRWPLDKLIFTFDNFSSKVSFTLSNLLVSPNSLKTIRLIKVKKI